MATALRPPTVGYAALWFGFLGTPAAWTLQELASLAIVSHFCYPRGLPLASPAYSGVWLAALGVTLATAALAAGSLGTAIALWRRLRPDDHADWRGAVLEAEQGRAPRYMAFSGILLGVLFLGLIAYTGIALFLVPMCGYP